MFTDDSPEIKYQELTIPATELFDPDDDPLEYFEAAIDDLINHKFENYSYNQLNKVNDNFRVAFQMFDIDEHGKKIFIYFDINRRFREKSREKLIQETEQPQREMQEYTLEDFIKNPTKGISFRSIWKEVGKDMSFQHLFSGGGFTRAVKADLATIAAFGISAFPHEMIHAGTNLATGGVNEKIVMNTLYGGALWEKLIPGIESKWMFPLLGGYVQTENPSTAATIATAVAPYILTPLGIYLAKKGKEKESIVISAAGSGLIAAHLGGVIGDWQLVGQNLIKESVEVVQDAFDVKTAPEYEIEALLAMALGGLYIGSKLLAVSYRASKATVNSIQNYVNKE